MPIQDRNGLINKRLGLLVPAGLEVQDSQVVKASGHIGMVVSEQLAVDRQGLLMKRFALLVPTLVCKS